MDILTFMARVESDQRCFDVFAPSQEKMFGTDVTKPQPPTED